MYRGAIGIIETVGLVGSVEASDAMTKCAEVDLLGREDIGGGLHSVWVQGDVGSVRAALEAGVRAAEAVGELHGVLLIPRPHDELQLLVAEVSGGAFHRHVRIPTAASLSEMNVHQLRALARELPEFPMKGREISRANREQLLGPLREILEHDEGEGD